MGFMSIGRREEKLKKKSPRLRENITIKYENAQNVLAIFKLYEPFEIWFFFFF